MEFFRGSLNRGWMGINPFVKMVPVCGGIGTVEDVLVCCIGPFTNYGVAVFENVGVVDGLLCIGIDFGV